MDIEKVIKLRNILKAGKNIPLMVYLDNMHKVIDESTQNHIIIWDDANGILYDITQSNDIYNTSPRDNKTVLTFGVDYNSIQALEAACYPTEDIPNVMSYIISSGANNMGKNIDTKAGEVVKDIFDKVLSTDTTYKTREGWNALTGANLDTSVDYYKGKGAITQETKFKSDKINPKKEDESDKE